MRAVVLAVCISVGFASAATAADFTVSIADTSGIASARAQYNARLPKDAQGMIVGELKTDAAYMQYVMQKAAEGWARQLKVAPLDAARAKCIGAGDCTDAAKVTK